DQGFLAAVEIDIDQQQSRFDANDIQREHSRRMDVESPSFLDQCLPDFDSLVPWNPDLIPEIARITRSRDVHTDSGDFAAGDVKIFEILDVRAFDNGAQQASRSRPLEG